ncbi:dienelactone hydrolase family protein [Amnibacterium kyonggiense]
MADVLVLPSVLGVRRGVLDAAERLEAAGHTARIADLYRGRSFDTYSQARAFANELGNAELDHRALEAAADLPDELALVGFSLGAVLAERIALRRPVTAVVLLSGGLSMRAIEETSWPDRLPLQVHLADGDPLVNAFQIDELVGDARAAGASATRFDYLNSGHLFTDPSLPDEYDGAATALAWHRITDFIDTTARSYPETT